MQGREREREKERISMAREFVNYEIIDNSANEFTRSKDAKFEEQLSRSRSVL